MAPRKRTTEQNQEPSTRVTRSSTKNHSNALANRLKQQESPKKKKPRTATTSPSKKKAKVEKDLQVEAVEEKVVEDGLEAKKTIIIEHCKQCNSFKTRALQVKSGLEKGLGSRVHVVLNPEKPRRGCFEIREEGDGCEKFVSLLDMKRPFSAMKALDMEEVVSDIIEKIK